MQTSMAFAMYKPSQQGREALLKILERHVPTLREYGMVTDRAAYLAQSASGVIIEVFEWKSDEAKKAAHEHPAVADIWEKMFALCSFAKMKDLPEAEKEFPNFEVIR